MQDGKCDKRVTTVLVAWRQLRRVGRGTWRRKGEVANETGDKGADGFEDGSGKQRTAATEVLDEVQGWKRAYDRDTTKDGLD